MPQPRKPKNSSDLSPDPSAPGPDQQTDSLVLSGILGESTVAGSVRLFLDAGFGKYYDIPSDAIEKREQLPAERSPLGVDSSILWVRKGTDLVLHQTETRKVEDEFLAGDFTEAGSFVPTEAGAAITIVATRRPTMGIACTVTNCDVGTGPTGTFRCTQIRCPIGPTGTFRCTQIMCPIGPTGTFRCTHIECPVGPTGWHGCTIANCPTLICDAGLDVDTIDRVAPERVAFPHTMVGCFPTMLRCPVSVARCPTTLRCPQPSVLTRCPSMGRCPSFAGCPSEICGGFGGPGEF